MGYFLPGHRRCRRIFAFYLPLNGLGKLIISHIGAVSSYSSQLSMSSYPIYVYPYNHATLSVTITILQPNERCVRRPTHLAALCVPASCSLCMCCAPFRLPRTSSLKTFSLLSLSRKLSTSFVLVHYPSPILSYVQRTELRWAPDAKTESLLSILAAHSFGHPPILPPSIPHTLFQYFTTNNLGHIIATVISHVTICHKIFTAVVT